MTNPTPKKIKKIKTGGKLPEIIGVFPATVGMVFEADTILKDKINEIIDRLNGL